MPEEFTFDDEMDNFAESVSGPIEVSINDDLVENDVLDPIDDYDLIKIKEQMDALDKDSKE